MNINSINNVIHNWWLNIPYIVNHNKYEQENRIHENLFYKTVNQKNKIESIDPEKINLLEDRMKTRLFFSTTEDGKVILNFYNKETKELLFQIPLKETQKQSEIISEFLERVNQHALNKYIGFQESKGNFVDILV
jgi:hypothetical protein